MFGLVVGLLVFRMLKSVDDYQVEILLSLALVAGGYAWRTPCTSPGPIAMVVAGLLIGNHGRSFAMSATTIEHLDLFWELIDEILNAVLFVLIGLEVLVLTFTATNLVAGLLVIPIVLAARLVSVGLPIWVLRRWVRFEPSMVRILTWGGSAGRDLGGPGPVRAGQSVGSRGARARCDRGDHLRRGGVLDRRARFNRRAVDPPMALRV